MLVYSVTGAHHVSFLYENQEGGLLGFYFTKICQELDENVKLVNFKLRSDLL